VRTGYHDFVVAQYLKEDPEVNCRNITIQVTDDCCLHCSYCYQTHKGHHYMTANTAKAVIDLLFKMYDDNIPNSFINHHTRGIILDFIGGEPFMNVAAMDVAVEHFIQCCIEKQHPWLTNFRISISSNGIMYFDEAV
jgi:sulfatase maturation enzyme AslB (radical SAM superfamily)